MTICTQHKYKLILPNIVWRQLDELMLIIKPIMQTDLHFAKILTSKNRIFNVSDII